MGDREPARIACSPLGALSPTFLDDAVDNCCIADGLRSLEFLVVDLNGRPLSPHQLLGFLSAAPPSLAKIKFENANLTVSSRPADAAIAPGSV